MKKQYMILAIALATTVSLSVSGCGTKDKTEENTPTVSSESSNDPVKKEEKIVQPKENSQNVTDEKKTENSDKTSTPSTQKKDEDRNSDVKEEVQDNNGNVNEDEQNGEADVNGVANEEENADTNENIESAEKNLIQTCGFVVESDSDGQTMMIAEGWEEAPPSVIEARKTGVSYYIGDATINCPCRITGGLVVYLTYYTENGVNIATEITSDGDEKEPRLYDYEYEYPETEQ